MEATEQVPSEEPKLSHAKMMYNKNLGLLQFFKKNNIYQWLSKWYVQVIG